MRNLKMLPKISCMNYLKYISKIKNISLFLYSPIPISAAKHDIRLMIITVFHLWTLACGGKSNVIAICVH